jgi:hypothetical protein
MNVSNIPLSEILSIIATVFSFVALTTFLISRLKDKKYNELKKQIEIDSMRNSFEKKLLDINSRLVSTEEKWKDVNHLILSSQRVSSNKSEFNEVPYSNFLAEIGIHKEDLKIDKNLVFVLTPYNDSQSQIYYLIKETCKNLNLKCLRGDEQFIKSDILIHTIKLIVKAGIIIANVDGRNPNVFYELGICHALDKPIIIVAQSPKTVPFDIKSKRIVFYDTLTRNSFIEALGSEMEKLIRKMKGINN